MLTHLTLVGREWLPISVSVLVSTVLTIAATGLIASVLRRPDDDGEGSS